MRRKLIVAVVICALVGAFFVGPVPALAVYDWCHRFDFSISQLGWDLYTSGWGVYQNGRFESVPVSGLSFEPIRIRASLTLASGVALTKIRVVGGASNPVLSAYWYFGGTTYWENSYASGFGDPYDVEREATRSGPVTSYIDIGLDIDNEFGDPFQYISDIYLYGTGASPFGADNCFEGPPPDPDGWAYPIKTSARASDKPSIYQDSPWISDSSGELDNDSEAISSYFYTSGSATDVHAMYAGTVTHRELLSGICTDPVGTGLTSTCGAYIEPLNSLGYPRRALYFAGAHLITITHGDGSKALYILQSPTIDIGDSVVKGCVIGKTLGFAENYAFSGFTNSGQGIVMVQFQSDTGDSYDGRDQLTQEPSGAACAAENDSCTLVGNPEFNGIGYWADAGLESGGFTLAPGGVGMQLPGSAYQLLVLDETQEYSISASYHRTSPALLSDTISFTLGYDAESITQDPFVEVATVAPVAGQQLFVSEARVRASEYVENIYALIVESSARDVVIDFVCVHATGETAPLPDSCILRNSEFDTTMFWTGSASFPGTGIALASDNQTLTQTVTLYPASGGAQNYIIEAVFRRYPANVSPDTLDLDWSFDAQSGSLGTYSESSFQWGAYTDTLTIAAETTATMTFTAQLTGDSYGTPETGVMQIQAICIRTADGTPPPGFDNPPIQVVCKSCTYFPTGDLATDFTEFVGWLNCFILSLWNCQAKTILYGIWTVLVNILAFLGFLRMWLSATVMTLTYYANGTILNLGIQIENALTGLRGGYAITSGGAGLWDAIVAIANAIASITSSLSGLGTTIVNGIVTALGQLFGLADKFLTLIASIVTLAISFMQAFATNTIGLAVDVIAGVLNGFNTGTTAFQPVGLSCDDPGAVLYYPCVGLYILDNTIFAAGSTVTYALMALYGAIAFALMRWALGRIQESFSA